MTLPALLVVTLLVTVLGGVALFASGMRLPFLNLTPTAPANPTDQSASPSSPESSLWAIVVTDATVPTTRSYAVYRSRSGTDALEASETLRIDSPGFVDAVLTEFDDDDEHVGDHEGRFRTVAASFESVVDARRAFAAAVADYEAPDGWGATRGLAVSPPLGEESIQLVTGSDYAYPRLKVLVWRVDNIVLVAIDFHPYDSADRTDSPGGFVESIAADMTARAMTR
jgi:hypothetical protein